VRAVSSPVGFGAKDIDFGVFWEGKTHLTAIMIRLFVYRKIYNLRPSQNSHWQYCCGTAIYDLTYALSYELATLPALGCFILSRQAAKRWRVKDSNYASTDLRYSSMDAACAFVWRMEVSQWGLGAETQWVWGQSTSLAKKTQKTDAGYIHDVREGALDARWPSREWWDGSLSYPQLTRDTWERRLLPKRGLGWSHIRKWFLEYAVSCNFTRYSVFL